MANRAHFKVYWNVFALFTVNFYLICLMKFGSETEKLCGRNRDRLKRFQEQKKQREEITERFIIISFNNMGYFLCPPSYVTGEIIN